MQRVLAAMLYLACATAGLSADLPDEAVLDKPVTLAVKGEALSDIMPILEKQTGLRVRAAREIADQKATIFVDGKPLRDVMEGLSSLFGYYWSVKDYSTGTIYELWQDEKSRQNLLKQREKAIDAALRAAMQDARFKAQAAAKTPEQQETLKAELGQGPSKDAPQTKARIQAITQVQKDPLLGICSGMLCALPENHHALLRLGVSVRFDARTSEAEWVISEAVRKTIADLLDSSGSSMMFSTPAAATQPPSNVDPDSVNISFSIKTQGSMLQILATVSGRVQPSDGTMMILPRVRAVPLSQQIVGSHVDPPKLPGGGDTSAWHEKAGISAADLNREAETYPEDSRTGMLNRSDMLAVLHRKAGVQVISDHYSHWTRWPVTEATSILDILDMLNPTDPNASLITQCADWGYDGKFLYSRVRDILSADASEVSNRLLRQWALVYRDKGALGLDEQASIATLNPDQTMGLRMCGRYLGIGDQIAMGMPALRLYGLLTAAQRQQAWAGGASVDAFTPEQRQALIQVFFRSGNSFFFSTNQTAADVQVGIWTTEPPTSRLDKPGNSLENPQNPEPPVTVAVREGATQLPGNLPAGLLGGKSSSTVITRGGPGQASGASTMKTVETIPYTMTFTFADGRTQQMGFNIPKGKATAQPAPESAK